MILGERSRDTRRAITAVLVTSVVSMTIVVGLTSAAGATDAHDGVKVVPIDQSLFGKSYGEWSARWWQWAFSIPAAESPLLDDTGANCGSGQRGRMWFLAGSFSATPLPDGGFEATAHRSCTISRDKGVFFPVLNAEADNACTDATVADLRAEVAALLDTETVVRASIDGRAVRNVIKFRAESPVFRIGPLPEDGISSCPPGSVGQAVADGYYVMLEPLPKGHHVVTFFGEVPGFRLDITYDLTVV